jgi:hypothetical protein
MGPEGQGTFHHQPRYVADLANAPGSVLAGFAGQHQPGQLPGAITGAGIAGWVPKPGMVHACSFTA